MKDRHRGKSSRESYRGIPATTYDAFLSSEKPATRIQFWGLILLGGSLAASGFVLLMIVLSRLSDVPFGVPKGLILLLAIGICGLIVYFGFVHVKRAFAAKH